MAIATPPGFIEEIDYDDLDIKDPVGKGSFGVVYMAIWQDVRVAVKMIESESEKISFTTELRQLSRVSHPNIICLYGACRNPVCLVMEFAECGSLYTLLHGPGPQPHYNSGHSMSWCLQCATGVAYLHGMKPKALIHRDLKPPNLLLTNHGVVLKICDFGTACDQHTHMTNNKGSAAWMAPEVFEGCQYSEKCDVFSWGIILWEVLTRRKPFDELGGPAFRIMWAVHTGARPNLIQGCPKPIEELMTRCWSRKPNERPSMDEIVDAMKDLMTFFPGGQEKLTFPSYDVESSSDGSAYETSFTDSMKESHPDTISDTVKRSFAKNRTGASYSPRGKQWGATNSPNVGVSRTQDIVFEARNRSRSHTPDPQKPAPEPTALAESSKGGTRRRSSTDLIAEIEQQTIEPLRTPGSSRSASPAPVRQVSRRVATGVNSPLPPSTYYPTPAAQSNSIFSPVPQSVSHPLHPQVYDSRQQQLTTSDGNAQWLSRAYITLELHLQPLPPSTSSEESLEIYRNHCRLAEDYLKVNTEIEVLKQRAQELKNLLEQDEKAKLEDDRLMMEYQQLVADNTSLQKWYDKMKKDLANVREKGQNKMWS